MATHRSGSVSRSMTVAVILHIPVAAIVSGLGALMLPLMRDMGMPMRFVTMPVTLIGLRVSKGSKAHEGHTYGQ